MRHCNHHPYGCTILFLKAECFLVFLALHSYCYHALKDEAPIRHSTAADHKFRTDTNPTDHRLTGYFFSFMNSVAFNTLSDCLYTQME